MLGLGSLVGNSGCNRIGCRSSKCQNILTVPIALVDKIYRNANDSVCESHFQELSLFSDNKVWYWEYDKIDGCIDYYSEKKTARKNFEKVLSVKPTDDGRYIIKGCYCDGKDVPEDWLNEKLEKISSSLERDFEHNKENISPITVAASFSDEKDMKKTNTKCMESIALQAFLKLFFETYSVDDIMESVKPELKFPDQLIKPLLISIEGSIGAGKSYLLAAMRKAHPEYVFIDEPVAFWESLRNEENLSLLEVFYRDQRRWSYSFQNCALLSRFKNIENTINEKAKQVKESLKSDLNFLNGGVFKPVLVVFVTERCLDTDKEVFAKLLRLSGQLDKLEYKLYETWYDLISVKSTPLSAIIYVDTLPDLCATRIKIRSRTGEDGIPKEYLEALHEQQENWINSTTVPTIRVKSDSLDAVENFISTLVSQH